MTSAKLSVRPLFAAIAILSIFISSCLFTGAHLVNAQAEESPTIDDRLENIEEILNELWTALDNIESDLDNIHATYVTREILAYELYSLKTEMSALEKTIDTEMSALDSTMSTEISALRVEISALHTIMGTYVYSLDERVNLVWQVELIIVAAVFGAVATYFLPRMREKDKSPALTDDKK